ncbi:MAG: monooxygenase [Myxococcota bacterium]
MRDLVLSGWVVVMTAACTPASEPAATTWHRDVAPIIERKCATCHEPGGIAPFPLRTLEEWKAVEASALDAIRTGRMPPFPARADCATYAPTQAMSDEQRAVIEKWISEGRQEGRVADFASLPGAPDRLTRVDLSLPMKEPFTPTHAPDEYRCFLIDWPFDVPKYITGYELRPGQKSQVHHADIFFLNPVVVPTWEARDAAEPGPGWECYDIPLGQEGSWIGTFVPGNRGVDFPEGTGLKVPVGSKIYIQVHYNLPAGAGLPDVSTLDLRLEDRVRRLAGVQAISDPKWITSRTMNIPANQKDVTHSFEIDPTMFSSIINQNFVDGRPLKLYATTMHLHQLGQSTSLEVLRADGSTTCAVDIPKWDFHWQLAYTLAEPIVINPGDRLKVSCTWDNTAANQPLVNGVQAVPKTRNWGARTEDEMCVAGVYVTQ